MPSKLKDFYDEPLIRSMAAEVQRAYPVLDTEAFVADWLRGLEARRDRRSLWECRQ